MKKVTRQYSIKESLIGKAEKKVHRDPPPSLTEAGAVGARQCLRLFHDLPQCTEPSCMCRGGAILSVEGARILNSALTPDPSWLYHTAPSPGPCSASRENRVSVCRPPSPAAQKTELAQDGGRGSLQTHFLSPHPREEAAGSKHEDPSPPPTSLFPFPGRGPRGNARQWNQFLSSIFAQAAKSMRAWELSPPTDLLTSPERLLQTKRGRKREKNPTTQHPTAAKKSSAGAV